MAKLQQATLQLKAAQSRHMNIGDNAGRPRNVAGVQKRFGGHERSGRETGRFDQLSRCLADEIVIVNDSNKWGISQGYLPMLMFEE